MQAREQVQSLFAGFFLFSKEGTRQYDLYRTTRHSADEFAYP